ncbi:MAG TPA: glycosyltransferase family 2 protein [Stellaceae bacterium]|nr:glycosyltransferase family 2 protein [Stellaceae bacterium]
MSETRPRIAAVIPALDEEEAIADVVAAVRREGLDEIVVVDSGSADRTVARAEAAGARVVTAPRRGYGLACATGVAVAMGSAEILLFLDGDGSDCPEFIPTLLQPLLEDRADFVIGSRSRGERERGSMGAHQLLAGRIAGLATRLLYGVRYTDMCPFRAIRSAALHRLDMREMTYGWNLEMQMRAARAGLRVLEVPVAHRRRAGGISKVSGTILGSLKASLRIAATFARVAFERHP